MSRIGLYVTPEARHFAPGDEPALRDTLAALERRTLVRDVGASADLCLDDKGCLPGGYRYTASAFRQVCTMACRGLYQAVVDVAGVHRAPGMSLDDCSFADAVALFNAVIRRRFRTRFASGVRLVRDADPKSPRVDGVLGPRYHHLENSTVYAMARDTAAQASFQGATLAGRRFMLRFVGRKPLFAREVPGFGAESFSAGYHFSNSEIAGEASVRAALLLIRAPTGTASLSRFGSGRLAHTGKNFPQRLNRMIQQVLAATLDPARLRAMVEALPATALGLGGADTEYNAQVDHLVSRINGQRVPLPLARRAVAAMMARGAYDATGQLRQVTRETLARRNAYDLYIALTREADGLPIGQREAIEQAAHGLLTGKWKPR
jgi:hypothetical protein